MKRDDRVVWATQDRSPADRAASKFCYGCEEVFKHTSQIPYNLTGALALTAHVSKTNVVHDMNSMGTGATCNELHDSENAKALARSFMISLPGCLGA